MCIAFLIIAKDCDTCSHIFQGRIQDFKLGGGALKKIAPSRGRREHFWGISCEKSRFYAKKSYFSNIRGGARNFWSISCEKSRFYAKKNHIFTNIFNPPPLNPPLYSVRVPSTGCKMTLVYSAWQY